MIFLYRPTRIFLYPGYANRNIRVGQKINKDQKKQKKNLGQAFIGKSDQYPRLYPGIDLIIAGAFFFHFFSFSFYFFYQIKNV